MAKKQHDPDGAWFIRCDLGNGKSQKATNGTNGRENSPQSQVLLRKLVSFVADLRFQYHHVQTSVPSVAAFRNQ